MLKKSYILGLMLMSLLTSACSAKDAEAKTVATSDNAAVAAAVNSDKPAKPSPSEQFALVFQKTEEGIKQALINNPKTYQDKVNFDTYPTPLGQVSPEQGKIEVVEFFSYGCGACFQAEATMHAMDKHLGDDVNFVRIPATFNPFFEHLARGYYAATALGSSPEAHNAIFLAIHIEKKDLRTPEALADFYSDYGVDKDQFLKAYKSFSVNTSVNRSKELGAKYKVGGVPNLVINGKYLSTGQKAGSYEAWAQIIGQLVDSERSAAK